ncbi:Na+/H+ antiporter subunit E [Streptacidiphilus jiangxiensis]|uniref:Multisubunit Na+/H+ antiporter, MnhE subunit n=1 Tax=Streptacidiphilus jiangxiensis TaxID=235985 RepID=A0A1H7H9Z4_STRJI|nr:Na+/H+ antiporter subunit E [Streptacidiphilus jiangxiensis]SEK46597.1 Multisubunit Na+/H+ antiporter, MnhE subunit [Streptacidiphilus jiangxiensis]
MPDHGWRTALESAAWWALLFVVYLVFISTLAPLELMIGAVASALAAAGAMAVHHAARPVVGPAGHLGAALWAWPGAVVTETVHLARLTWAAARGRPARGRFSRVRLRPEVGVPWACALLSATPGSCVVDVHEDQEQVPVLSLHSLFDSPSRLESVLTGAEAS